MTSDKHELPMEEWWQQFAEADWFIELEDLDTYWINQKYLAEDTAENLLDYD